MTDSSSLIWIIQENPARRNLQFGGTKPYVAVSFEEPEYTAGLDGLGVLRILEAIRILGLDKKTRFYQASTSELYGLVQEIPQRETTPSTLEALTPSLNSMATGSLLTIAKPMAWAFRKSISLTTKAQSAAKPFVTRKITRGALARIKLGLQGCLYLGNLDAKRDWGMPEIM